MKKLIDDVARVVPDMVLGYVRMHPGLVMLDGQQVVMRADVAEVLARGEVALISGGGSGHEPAHAGYIGQGMLTAAVCGDVFTSPSADAVLAAIRAVAGRGGVLLIVKNYTGDRLNFGLAAEIARSEGAAVEMVVVDDDVALDISSSNAGRRGIAGTVFIHKIAGTAAAQGRSLAEVLHVARDAIAALGTMGVALSPCTVPAAGTPGFELGLDEIELGLGIHGEAGVRRMPMVPASALVALLLERIAGEGKIAKGDRVALLVNNLGTTPPLELAIVSGDALSWLDEHGIEVERAWSGTFLTALDMAGVSLSLLKLDDARLALLDAATGAPAWPGEDGRVVRHVTPHAASSSSSTSRKLNESAPGAATKPAGPVADAILAVCAALLAAEDELTKLDQIVGDGDLGISLARGARAIEDEMPSYPLSSVPDTLRALSATLRRALGGTSGPLYAIGLLRAARALDARGAASNVDALGSALRAAATGISETGGAALGDRTMLDALIPAADAAERMASGGARGADAVQAIVEAAEAGATATAGRVARRGRSSYLGERALGHRDPGAVAVALWLRVLLAQPQSSGL